MGLYKSYSNYVIQKKHQQTNDGIIYERDFSTVGGIGDTFNSSSKMYRQGTFVFTVNNEIITPKIYNTNQWEKNGDSDVWRKSDIDEKIGSQNSLNIYLKQDYYKLKDFSYYGSCVELIRSSINDIIQRFPSELYVPYQMEDNLKKGFVVFDNDNNKLGNVGVAKGSSNWDKYIFLVDNPLKLDIHSEEYLIPFEEQKNIKYAFINYEKYEYYDARNNIVSNIDMINKVSYSGACFPYCFAELTIIPANSECNNMVIYCYYDDKGNICYLTDYNSLGNYIRPKNEYLEEFYNSLDSFQKILLNKESQPKYTAIFEVMEETDYGYQSLYEKFTFPTTYGGYNLDVFSPNYITYINLLVKYANFFDSIYTNNLYRQLTHESLKNFDWTDTLKRGEEIKEDYIESGDKIQKMINLCGRELDELKFYIDGISKSNNITYNDANNLPDYFLTDTLEIEGWDVKNIFPYKISSTSFEENLTLKYDPYNANRTVCGSLIDFPNGYVSGYWFDNCLITQKESTEQYVVDKKGNLRNKVKQYVNKKFYSMQELNNKFMKHLKLNSRSISQKKGTIESIEAMLSLFGLKSKRWYDSLDSRTQHRFFDSYETSGSPYDYEIKEYVAITNPLKDVNNSTGDLYYLPHTPFLYDFFNTTKIIPYNTYEYRNGIHTPYIGLPVRYYEKNGERLLYPYFSPNIAIDGKPYFQMNGGWVHKNYEINGITVSEIDGGYVDTNTHISVVDNLGALLKLDSDVLYDGVIYYVKNIIGECVCVNDEIYQIEHLTNENGDNVRYFTIKIVNHVLKIGKQEWFDNINTYDELGNLFNLNLNNLSDGYRLKIFINNENKIYVTREDNILTNYAIFKDGKMVTSEEEDAEEKTNYFILIDKKWKNTLGFFGWNQLNKNSYEYKTISNFKTYYKGNNPHVNGLKYDDGVEYIRHFNQLFKYAISNELFNKNCYQSVNEYMSSLNYIENNVGFDNILEINDCIEKIKLYEDTKIHHFCDYNDSNEIKYFAELESGENTYDFYDKEEYAYLNQDDALVNTKINDEVCLDQIINLKNIDIIFKKYNNDVTLQRKYFDEIILHYLLQVIPPNVILNIKFE